MLLDGHRASTADRHNRLLQVEATPGSTPKPTLAPMQTPSQRYSDSRSLNTLYENCLVTRQYTPIRGL